MIYAAQMAVMAVRMMANEQMQIQADDVHIKIHVS
jgi:hypothetical protein